MQKLPPLFTILVFLSFGTCANAGDAVTVVTRATQPGGPAPGFLTLAAGEKAVAQWGINSRDNIATSVMTKVTIGGTDSLIPLFTPATGSTTAPPIPLTISGPATITIQPDNNWQGTGFFSMATFDVTRAIPPAVTPAYAAVIPEDANGQYQVLLESSTDLVTWTSAALGTYSGNTQKRFFRSRIVKQQ
jgi:hypothetical protein